MIYTDGYTGDVYLLAKMLLPTAGKKRVYNLQSKQMVKHLSQVSISKASQSPIIIKSLFRYLGAVWMTWWKILNRCIELSIKHG